MSEPPKHEGSPEPVRRELGEHGDYGAYERSVRDEMRERFKDYLKDIAFQEREDAVRKLAKQEMGRRAKERMKQAGSQPNTVAGAVPERKTVPERPREPEKPLAILDAGPWLKWDDVVYDEGQFHLFTAEFIPELADALRESSSDTQVRTRQIEMIRNLYQGKLFRMYANQYPDRQVDELRENVQGWLDDRWREALAAARRLSA